MTIEQRRYSQRITDYAKEIMRIFEEGGVDYVTARMILRDVEEEMFQKSWFPAPSTPKKIEKPVKEQDGENEGGMKHEGSKSIRRGGGTRVGDDSGQAEV